MVEPQGARANSWQDVADLSATFGVYLDGWQELVLRAAMGERADATWAAKRVGLSVPRQNGKSQLMVARILAGALLFGEKKIVVSAHQQDTAREGFAKLVEIIEADANAALRSRIKSVMNAFQRESVKFTNGSVVQFKARSGPGGKGFSSDCLLLDEAQILGSRAWTSINSTMSAMPNPQVWLLGTPPQEEDDSYTFEMVRNAALGGKSTAAAWAEWAVDTSSEEYLAAKADLAARHWTPAVEYLCWSGNPAWNVRINHEVVQGEHETYSPDRFAQDRLGIWRDESAMASREITAEEWTATEVTEPPAGVDQGVRTLAIAFSPDGARQSTAGAIKHATGAHVEIVGAHTGPRDAGVRSLVHWLTEDPEHPERWRTFAQIAMCGRAGATVLFEALRAAGVPAKVLQVASTPDYFASCAAFLDAVRDKTVTHPKGDDGDVLDESVAVSVKKNRGTDGAWGWESSTPDGDETPLEAVSVAYRAAMTTKRRPGRQAKAVVMTA